MKLPSILILAANISFVKALIPTPRYNGGCGTVGSKLFCYGGTANRQTTADHYVLDLTNDFNVEKSIDAWNSIVPDEGFELEPNSLFSIVPLNDSYLIHGGLGYGTSGRYIKNFTTVYNTLQNSWTTVQAQNQSLMTPSREETSTLDLSNRIWTWGGISDNATSPNITSAIYHNELQILDLNTMAWTLPDNGTSSSSRPSFVRPRLAHTATLTKSGQSIYYIGGLQVSESEVLSSAPMNEILEYHIANNTWIMHKSPENTTIPSPRRLHTATQVPNADLIMVYGGSVIDASLVVADYCYLLNTTSFVWTPVNIANADDGAGSRFGHSAVLYQDKSLFIVFGADDLGNLRNDLFVLDITKWQWVPDFKTDGNYPAVSAKPPSSTSKNPTQSSTPSSNSESFATAITTDQAFISTNYMKTVYLMMSIVIIFTFL